MTRNDIFEYVSNQYGTDPDYPWAKTPDGAVLRHRGSRKWYGLVMKVKPKSLGLTGLEEVDILNLKCDHRIIGELIKKPCFLPAYHMNKEHWITVILSEADSPEEIHSLIDISYELTK